MRLLLATALFTALSAGAHAADAGMPMEEAPVTFNWTGFYVGVQGGYGWSDYDVYSDFLSLGTTTDGDSGFAGVMAGFNYQMDSFVLGAEADINKSWDDPSITLGGFAIEGDLEWFGSVRGRAGVAFDRTMVYATGGVAFARLKYDTPIGDGDLDFTGWTLGAGVEHAMTDNVLLRGEYRYYDFGDDVAPLATTTIEPTMHTISVGVAYKF